MLSGGNCAPAAPVASCPSGYGGSPGSYSWNGSSWILSGQNCTAPVTTAFIGGGSSTPANTQTATSNTVNTTPAVSPAGPVFGPWTTLYYEEVSWGMSVTGLPYNYGTGGSQARSTWYFGSGWIASPVRRVCSWVGGGRKHRTRSCYIDYAYYMLNQNGWGTLSYNGGATTSGGPWDTLVQANSFTWASTQTYISGNLAIRILHNQSCAPVGLSGNNCSDMQEASYTP